MTFTEAPSGPRAPSTRFEHASLPQGGTPAEVVGEASAVQPSQAPTWASAPFSQLNPVPRMACTSSTTSQSSETFPVRVQTGLAGYRPLEGGEESARKSLGIAGAAGVPSAHFCAGGAGGTGCLLEHGGRPTSASPRVENPRARDSLEFVRSVFMGLLTRATTRWHPMTVLGQAEATIRPHQPELRPSPRWLQRVNSRGNAFLFGFVDSAACSRPRTGRLGIEIHPTIAPVP